MSPFPLQNCSQLNKKGKYQGSYPHQLSLLVARRLCSSAPFLIWPPFPPPLPGQPLQVCPLLLWSSKARGYQLSWPPSEPPQTPTNSVSHMGLIVFTLPQYMLLICRILWYQPLGQDLLQQPGERKLNSQLLYLFYPDSTIWRWLSKSFKWISWY